MKKIIWKNSNEIWKKLKIGDFLKFHKNEEWWWIGIVYKMEKDFINFNILSSPKNLFNQKSYPLYEDYENDNIKKELWIF